MQVAAKPKAGSATLASVAQLMGQYRRKERDPLFELGNAGGVLADQTISTRLKARLAEAMEKKRIVAVDASKLPGLSGTYQFFYDTRRASSAKHALLRLLNHDIEYPTKIEMTKIKTWLRRNSLDTAEDIQETTPAEQTEREKSPVHLKRMRYSEQQLVQVKEMLDRGAEHDEIIARVGVGQRFITAVNSGFDSVRAYDLYLLKLNGFGSYGAYHNYLVEKRGFSSREYNRLRNKEIVGLVIRFLSKYGEMFLEELTHAVNSTDGIKRKTNTIVRRLKEANTKDPWFSIHGSLITIDKGHWFVKATLQGQPNVMESALSSN